MDKIDLDKLVSAASCHFFDAETAKIGKFGTHVDTSNLLNVFRHANNALEQVKMEVPDHTKTVMMPCIRQVVDKEMMAQISRLVEHQSMYHRSLPSEVFKERSDAFMHVIDTELDRMKINFIDYLIARGFISLEMEHDFTGNGAMLTMRAYVHHPQNLVRDDLGIMDNVKDKR